MIGDRVWGAKATDEAGPIIFVSETHLEYTGLLLASFAEAKPSEGVVYWFGLEHGKRATVTTLVVPNARTTPGSVETSVTANAEAQGAMIGTPLVLLGQAHSHAAWHVEHSVVDDERTFARFNGAVSLVVPYYGRYGLDLDECGLYRHVNGAFRKVPRTSYGEHLVVLPGVRDYRSQGTSHARDRA